MPLPRNHSACTGGLSRGGSLCRQITSTTPEDEEISLHIGDAFDIVAERKQTDYRKPSDRLYEFEYDHAAQS